MTAPTPSQYRHLAWALPIAAVLALASFGAPNTGSFAQQDLRAQVLAGRILVINHDCAGCHGGIDPSQPGWLDGVRGPAQIFQIGPCGQGGAPAQPCFHTYPRNLTPENTTGLGRFTARQLFNALRYGLRPEDTPDVEITSTIPGKGNFPAMPHYLAAPMPWMAWRHMTDRELHSIVAYLQHGLKPSVNKVPDSEGPPDFWASEYTVEKIGTLVSPPFPAKFEKLPE